MSCYSKIEILNQKLDRKEVDKVFENRDIRGFNFVCDPPKETEAREVLHSI